MSHAVGSGLHAIGNSVKDTVKGALRGEIDDIAKVAVVAGVAANAIPVSTGLAVLAGDSAIGALVDTFA